MQRQLDFISLDDGDNLDIIYDDDVDEQPFPFEGLPQNEQGKPVLSQLPGVVHHVRPHMSVTNPNIAIDEISAPIQQLLTHITTSPSLRDAPFLDIEEIDEIFTAPINIALDAFSNSLNHDYIPTNIREKQSDIASAYVSPLLAFLDKELPNLPSPLNVLILGAGEGKDIRRIQQRRKGPVRVVAVEPSKKAYEDMMSAYPTITGIKGTAGGTIASWATRGPFHLVISNMSFHYIMGVESATSVIRGIERCMAPEGIMFGSFVDVPSVKANGHIQTLKNGHSVTYVGEAKKETVYGEQATYGIATISVAGVYWQDPYFEVAHLYELFSDSRLSLNVYDGHTMVIGGDHHPPLYKAPQEIVLSLKRPELQMYRCAIITFNIDPVYVAHCPQVTLRDDRTSGTLALAHTLRMNKGKPLQPWETQYVHPSGCWIADKKDGVSAKLVYTAGGLTIIMGDGRVVKVPGFSGTYKKDFVLQVELVDAAPDNQHALVDLDKKWLIVVLDVIRAPWGVSGSFFSRWRWLEDVYVHQRPEVTVNGKRTLSHWPFALQRWVRLDTLDALELLNSAREGVVIQGLLAPPGALRQDAGSAHYVKRVWTVDLLMSCGVCECTLEGTIVRLRPDKPRPNPPSVIRRVKSAVKYEDFVAYIFTLVVGTPGANWKRVMRNVACGVNISEWTPADKVWAYNNRFDPVLNTLAPQCMSYLNIVMIEHCAKVGVRVEEEIAFEEPTDDDIVIEDEDGNPLYTAPQRPPPPDPIINSIPLDHAPTMQIDVVQRLLVNGQFDGPRYQYLKTYLKSIGIDVTEQLE